MSRMLLIGMTIYLYGLVKVPIKSLLFFEFLSNRVQKYCFYRQDWIKLLEPLVSQNRNLKILVCVPAFNEGENISGIVDKSKKYADEVIVYDDGSTGGTFELATAAGATFIKSSKNNGNRVEIRSLFQAAKQQNADIMVTLDSDGQHDPDQIPCLIEPIEK